MSEERFAPLELEQLAQRLRENEATIEKLTLKLDEFARFAVSVDARVDELSYR